MHVHWNKTVANREHNYQLKYSSLFLYLREYFVVIRIKSSA